MAARRDRNWLHRAIIQGDVTEEEPPVEQRDEEEASTEAQDDGIEVEAAVEAQDDGIEVEAAVEAQDDGIDAEVAVEAQDDGIEVEVAPEAQDDEEEVVSDEQGNGIDVEAPADTQGNVTGEEQADEEEQPAGQDETAEEETASEEDEAPVYEEEQPVGQDEAFKDETASEEGEAPVEEEEQPARQDEAFEDETASEEGEAPVDKEEQPDGEGQADEEGQPAGQDETAEEETASEEGEAPVEEEGQTDEEEQPAGEAQPGESDGDENPAEAAEQSEAPAAAIYSATIDLSEVDTYPISMTEMMAKAALPEDAKNQAEVPDDVAAAEGEAEAAAEEASEADVDAAPEAPARSIEYDTSLLSIEAVGEDHLITPIQSFERTEIIVANGSRYELTLVNCTLTQGAETEAESNDQAFPAQDFEEQTDYIRVVVSAPAGAFPAGTTMKVADVADEKTLTDIEDTVSEEFVEVRSVHAVDITFTDADGNEIEPLVPISVVMSLVESEQIQKAETVVVHVDDEGATQVVESESAGEAVVSMEMSAGEQQAADYATEGAEGESRAFQADSFSIYAMVQTEAIETRYIAADGTTWNISVGYGKEAEIPAGASLAVSEVVGEDAEGYLAQTAEALRGRETITLARFFDITILDSEGREVQPRAAVEVKAVLADGTQDAVKAVHFAEEGPEIIEASQDDEAVVFEAEGFSVYGIVYTVDFHYGVDGQTYEFTLPGGGAVGMRELAPALGLVEDDADAVGLFVESIEGVAFSNEELVKPVPVEMNMTVGALKQKFNLESEYSAELNDRVLWAPDWALVSLKPFETEETLTIAMKNGEVITAAVTDAQLQKSVISANGETYVITVTYGDEAEIPDDAELKVREILPGDAEYAEYLAKAQRAASGKADADEATEDEVAEANVAADYARFFDIEIWANDQKVEPAAAVTVDIALADAPRTGEALKVVHFDEKDGPVVMQTEAGEVDAETTNIRFETESFSTYGVVRVPNTGLFTSDDAKELVGKGFTISRNGHYFTADIATGNHPDYLASTENANEAAIWYIKSVNDGNNYVLYTIDASGREMQLSFNKRNDQSAHVRLGEGNGNWFTITRDGDNYVFHGFINGTDHYYLNDWNQGAGLAGYYDGNNPYDNEKFQLNMVNYPTQDNKNYFVVLKQRDQNNTDRYYLVQNDGRMEEVTIDDNGIFHAENPMMWKLENDNGKRYLTHQAFARTIVGWSSLPNSWYNRYIDPSSADGINDPIVADAIKTDNDDPNPPDKAEYLHTEENNAKRAASEILVVKNGNDFLLKSANGNDYIGVDGEGPDARLAGCQSKDNAAAVILATADRFKVETDQAALRPYNLVNHIDIEVDAKARLTVPLGNGKVYDVNHNEVTIPGNRVLNLEEHVDVTPQDLKNATIAAYTKSNGVRNYIDNAYTVTGYSGNAPIGITNTQVRVEGRFLVSTYFNGTDSNGASIFKDEDTQSESELNKRYDNRVFYDLSTKKNVKFYYTYTDPSTNQKIDLYDAKGNRLCTETIVELTGSFDYWDPLNACPILHDELDPEKAFNPDWWAHKIPRGANGGSGMDFTIGADEEGKYKKPGILITKYIYDEQNNLIELASETTSQFDVWERPIDGFANANASRTITNTVSGVNKGGEHTKPDDSNLCDTQLKQPSNAYDGFTKTHTVTVDVVQSGTGSKYDFSVESGMIYIQEKDVSPTIVDKNGITWNYVHTIIKTEYVKRAATDTQEEFHYTRVMTHTDNLNSVPDVAGRYFKDDDDTEYSSDSLEFYVYNVYSPSKTSVRVQKSWEYEDGAEFILTNDDYADITLGRYKLVDKSSYQWSEDQRKVASVIICQMNYNPDNAIWYKNNYDFRAGDTINVKLYRQKQEVVRYSINGNSYTDILQPYENGNGELVCNEIQTTIPSDGILRIALDDEWGGISGDGRLIVEKNGTVIPSKDDGDKPESPQENPDMEYTLDVNDNGTPRSFGPLHLNNANLWTGEQGGLDAYDENGNAYRYFILREDGSSIGGVIPVIGTTEKGESLTSTGFVGDPTLTVNNLVPKSSITIKKLDTDGRPLPGAVFSLSVLKKGAWSLVPNAGRVTITVPQDTSDAQATIPNLFDGRYKLTEIEAPEGYFIRNRDIYFTITNGDAKLTRDDGSGQSGNQEGDIYNNLIEVGGNLFDIQNERNRTVNATKTWGDGTGTAPDGTEITWTIRAMNSDNEDVTTFALPTGETAAHTVSAAPWETTWPNLPLAVKGKDVTYTVTETAARYGTHVYIAEEIAESNASVDTDTEDTFAFTNDLPTTGISVEKTWGDLTEWPDQLVVMMTLKGTTPAATEGADPEPVDLSSLPSYTIHDDTTDEDRTVTQKAVILLQSGKTSHTWHNLPQYASNGKPITYTVEEAIRSMQTRIVTDTQKLKQDAVEKEHMQTELSLAARIQEMALPRIQGRLAGREEFSLDASMTPAKNVGGDFYDFFFLDNTHLVLLIADVSGKGIPAALFMMSAQNKIKSCASLDRSPAQILTAANIQLCENNDLCMFVTVWLGILDLATGRLAVSSAGHEKPILGRAGKAFELVEDCRGMVMGGMKNARYTDYEITLNPGDVLFQYTDGVPEASNSQNEFFGTDRMLEALNQAGERKPAGLLEQMRSAVDEFVGDAQQFDDLTMLCIRYQGADTSASKS